MQANTQKSPSEPAAFAALGLREDILAGLREINFENPTPIQAQVIPLSLSGKDVVGLAQTGSGKTAAFVLPILQKIKIGAGFQALILCPTREIAQQTKEFLGTFSKSMGLKTACLIGGVKMPGQEREVKAGPEVVVATPGRFHDFLERRLINPKHVIFLVLDEADHMLDMGFLPQVDRILRALPKERQTLMFSATMPPPIERLTSRFLKDPEKVDIIPEGRAAAGITHRLYLVDRNDKEACLVAQLKEFPESTMVFTRMKIDADWVARFIEKSGFSVGKLHSDLPQSERTRVLQAFRNREIPFLVATNIASRGLDIPGIQHIIHFDVPETVEDYIHRSGRTARNEQVGTVSTIGTIFEKGLIKEIEKALGQEIQRYTVTGVASASEFKTTEAPKRKRKW
jgi:ATP-dependent RNA helicase RhlE